MIENYSALLIIFNLIVVPIVVILRIRRHIPGALLNPLVYLVIGSYCYMTLGSAFLFPYNVPGYEYSENERALTDFFSNFYTLIFFCAYCLTKDPKTDKINFFPQNITAKIALILVVLITPIFIFLILNNFEAAYKNYTNREISHLLWATVYEKYKVGALNNIYAAAVCILAWRKRNLKFFWLFLFPSIFSLMFNGKLDPLKFLIFAYINIVCINKRLYFVPIGLTVGIIFLTGIVRLSENYGPFTILLGEFVGPRFSTDIIFYEMRENGNFKDIMTSTILSLIPGKVGALFFEQRESYISILANNINIGWHIMGSPLGEALYYGGIIFAGLTPLIIVILFLSIHRMRLYQSLPGFLFVIFMALHMPLMMREGFFRHLFTIVYLMFSYLLWISIVEGLLKKQATQCKRNRITVQENCPRIT